MKRRYVFDIESDGLMDEATKIHCIILYDIDKDEIIHVDNWDAIKLMSRAKLLIGHNIVKFDLPMLKKFYDFEPKGEIFDTIIATRLLFPDIRDADFKRGNDFPTKLIGRHSLESWGHRIGEYKAHIETDWKTFTPEMLEYCKQDVHVNVGLYRAIEKKGYSKQAMELEHDVAKLIFKQEQYGFMFDEDKAKELYGKLEARRLEIEEELQELFPPIIKETTFIPKVNNKTRGYVKGQPFIKKHEETFNPSSRQHVSQRLIDKYDWKPDEYTTDGKPKVDDSVLNSLDYP